MTQKVVWVLATIGFMAGAWAAPSYSAPEIDPIDISQLQSAASQLKTNQLVPMIDELAKEDYGTAGSFTRFGKDKMETLLNDALNTLKNNQQFMHRAELEALIARCYLANKMYSKAAECYKSAISDLKNALQVDRVKLDGQTLSDCHLGECISFVKLGQINEAEAAYKQKISDVQAWSADGLPARAPEGSFLMAAVAAHELADYYVSKNQPQKALQMFQDMMKFLMPDLNSDLLDPRSTILPIMRTMGKAKITQLGEIEHFDHYIGPTMTAPEMMQSYVDFARTHPKFVAPATMQEVSELQSKIRAIQAADYCSEQVFSARAQEFGALSKFITEPNETLKSFDEEISQRKKRDPSEPTLPLSMTLIGESLLTAGIYSDAERYLNEALALRTSQGKVGEPGAGICLRDLASLYLDQDKQVKARPLIEKALKLTKTDPNDKYSYAKSQLVLAKLESAESKKAQAENTLNNALSVLAEWEHDKPLATSPGYPYGSSFAQSQKIGVQQIARRLANFYQQRGLCQLAELFNDQGQYQKARDILSSEHNIFGMSELETKARRWLQLARAELGLGNNTAAAENMTLIDKEVTEHHVCKPLLADIDKVRAKLSKAKN